LFISTDEATSWTPLEVEKTRKSAETRFFLSYLSAHWFFHHDTVKRPTPLIFLSLPF
jgi:hypothetical protein